MPEFVTKWVLPHLYVDCALIQVKHLPINFNTLPGKAKFAYLFTQNNVYLIDKIHNTATLVKIKKQEIDNLKTTLKLIVPPNAPDVYLIEGKLNPSKLREIILKGGIAPPINSLVIMNAVIIFGIFGFIPGAWTLGFPALILYGLSKQRRLANYLYKTFSTFGLPGFFSNYTILGERIGEIVSDHPISVLKGLAAFGLLLIMGLNSFSVIALYGIYRHSNDEWLKSAQKWLNGFYDFGLRFVSRSLLRFGFYRKVSMGMALAILFAWQAYSYGIFAFAFLLLDIIQALVVAMGFNILFNDLSYACKNPVKIFLDNSGKLLGAFWGRWVAYRIFSGTVSGNLGPVIGHVLTPGLFSGMISSFLSPSGSFTVGSGFNGVLFAKIQNFLNTIFTSIFFTTEMQLQGSFYGTVGPTSLQIFVFMVIGALVGYLVERLVNKFTHHVVKDTSNLPQVASGIPQNLHPQVLEIGPHVKWHIVYFSIATALLMYSPAGATLIVFVGGSLLRATCLGASGLLMAWGGLEGIRLVIAHLWGGLRSQRVEQPPRVEALRPAHPHPRDPLPERGAPPIVPGFNNQREANLQQPAPDAPRIPRGHRPAT